MEKRESLSDDSPSVEAQEGITLPPQLPRGFSLPADPNIISWDGDDDPANPYNWSIFRKVIELLPIVAFTFLSPLVSNMFPTAVPQVLEEFKVSNQMLATFCASGFILGWTFGPLIVAPLSEIYGRYPVYIVCNILFIVFTVAQAVCTNMTQLIVFGVLSGIPGVCPITISGGVIADLLRQEERGVGVTLVFVGDLLGPLVGPIAGGYINANLGWRWDFWIVAITYGFFTIYHAILCHETYTPVLLARKTMRLRRASGNERLRSVTDTGMSKTRHLKLAWLRPIRMLFLSPIAGFLAIYVAIMYGILYLLCTTFTFIFEGLYHFTEETIGYTYVGMGVGMIIGIFGIGVSSDRILQAMARKKASGALKPEYRLIPLLVLNPLAPIGLFIYGWTAQYHIQYAVPLFGTFLYGAGQIAILVCTSQYLIDAFPLYEASALGANTILRSLVGAILPLGGLQMYEALGIGWGNSLLGFISLGLLPIPWIFYIYADKLRGKFHM